MVGVDEKRALGIRARHKPGDHFTVRVNFDFMNGGSPAVRRKRILKAQVHRLLPQAAAEIECVHGSV